MKDLRIGCLSICYDFLTEQQSFLHTSVASGLYNGEHLICKMGTQFSCIVYRLSVHKRPIKEHCIRISCFNDVDAQYYILFYIYDVSFFYHFSAGLWSKLVLATSVGQGFPTRGQRGCGTWSAATCVNYM